MRALSKFFLCLVPMILGPSFAQDSADNAALIEDFGIYSTGKEAPELLVNTDSIPAEVGTVFGVRVRLNHESAKSYSFRWTFPEMRNPANGQVWTEMTGSRELSGDRAHPILARINHEWEAVPGDWTVQLLKGEKVLVEKVFRVIAVPTERS